jgi:putative transposase
MVALDESTRLPEQLIGTSCDRQGILPGQLTLHADRGVMITAIPADLVPSRSLVAPGVLEHAA